MSNMRDSPEERGLMLLVGLRVPSPWVEVGSNEDSTRTPVSETSFYWHLHRIAVQQLEEVAELEVSTSEVIKDDVFLTSVPVEPGTARMDVRLWRVRPCLLRFSCTSGSPVDLNIHRPGSRR